MRPAPTGASRVKWRLGRITPPFPSPPTTAPTAAESRMISGSNLISMNMHARDLDYVNDLDPVSTLSYGFNFGIYTGEVGAVNIEVMMPILNVMAKPFTGPVPSMNSTMAASNVVTLASVMVLKAFS